MKSVRVFLLGLLGLLPLTVVADGKMFAQAVALTTNVTIPDQRALIHFADGTQRLVIETRFTGTGTNFAWVIPLPAPPVIEEATTGLFPTLEYLLRPQIVHRVPRYYWAWTVSALLIFLFVAAAKRRQLGLFLAFILFLLLATMMLPSLSKGSATAAAAADTAVTVLDRKLVGVFETTTITSTDADAVPVWLRENGFFVSTNSETVIADYVRDGWVFVTAKVRAADDTAGPRTAHPVSFTFPTEQPVYPLRLTGVENGPVSVELYVFGPARAAARGFRTVRCAQPNYPALADIARRERHLMLSKQPNIAHPLLRRWTDGAPVVTQLTATLSPAEMRQDVSIEWRSFVETLPKLFSRQGARTVALNWSTSLLATGLLVAWLLSRLAPHRQSLKKIINRSFLLIPLASLALAAVIYFALPKVEVQLVRLPYYNSRTVLYNLNYWLQDTNSVTKAELSARAQAALAEPPMNPEFREWFKRFGPYAIENLLVGDTIREEDSPGNFTFRESCDELEMLIYDAQGGAHPLPERWTLRRESVAP